MVSLLYSPWLIPESPRWLLRKGRLDKAKALIDTMAKWNKSKWTGSLDDYRVKG